jgi:hypothetical protein
MSSLGPLGPLHGDPEPQPQQDGAGGKPPKICIYPGCARPAVPPHPLGGPQPAFCDLEEHNALTAHQERQRRAAAAAKEETHDGHDDR